MDRQTIDELERRLEQRTTELRAANEQLAYEAGERKQAEEASREWEARYRSLVENVPDVIMVVDHAGKILFINHTTPEFTVDEVVGTSIFDYVAASHHRGVKEYVEWIFDGGEPATYEVTAQVPGGTAAWHSARVGTIKRDGQVVALTLIATDITERKRVEDALQESEHFLQGVFDAIQDGLSVLDSDLNVVRVNQWMEEMYADQAPLVGGKCYTLFQQRQSPCLWCPSIETLKTGEARTEEVPYPIAREPDRLARALRVPAQGCSRDGGRRHRICEGCHRAPAG